MTHFTRSSALRLGASAAVLWLPLAAALAGPMDDEKLYSVPEQQLTIHPRLPELMTAAMHRPDELTVLQGLAEVRRLNITAASPRVLELLTDPRPMVRLSAARVVDALDLKAGADVLLKWAAVPAAAATSEQTDEALVADALLARWKEGRAAAAWLARVQQPAGPTTLKISAARSLGELRATDAAGPLSAVVTDASAPLDLRITAAEALAQIGSDNTATAAKLAGSDPLLAVKLLSTAKTPAALDLLVTLAQHPQQAVQHAALARLQQADPGRVHPLAAELIRSSDPAVRLDVVRSVADWKAAPSVSLLLGALDDHHPDVRTAAEKELRALAAEAALRDAVRDGARKIAEQAAEATGPDAAAHWREAEQAALLLGQLDDKASAPTLVKLMRYGRLEVRVASVVSLRSLDVEATRGPIVALMDELIRHIVHRIEAATKAKNEAATAAAYEANRDDSILGNEVAQTLGLWRVREAEPLMRKLIPKESPASAKFRAAAIWGLGRLHEGKVDEELAKKLIGRVFDLNPLNPEAEPVRLASVVAIGRMKAASQVKALENRYNGDDTEIRCAARWAVHEISGKELDAVTLPAAVVTDAFISPLDPTPKEE